MQAQADSRRGIISSQPAAESPAGISRDDRLGQSISKAVGRAICDYDMIAPHDRIMVAVSGGKDSLCLLHMLHDRRRYAPLAFDSIAAHVVLQEQNARVVADYCRRHEFPLLLLKPAAAPTTKSACFTCSSQRRRALFAAAREQRCTKLAFGHHQDDIIQTILLNLFFVGEISAMPPTLSLFGGRLRVIRPLAYVSEQRIVDFARRRGFPTLPVGCAHEQSSQRRRVAELITALEQDCADVRVNIFRSLRRIKKGYLT